MSDKWINKCSISIQWDIYHLAIKRNEVLIHAAMWTNLETLY